MKRLLLAAAVACTGLAACGWDLSRPFDRDAPAVKQAIADLDAGDASSATSHLEDYLSTGAWTDDLDEVTERAKEIIYF